MRRPCLEGCGRASIDGGSRCGPCQARHENQKNVAYGRAYREERAPLMGRPCELQLPGCTGIADTADHVVPRSLNTGERRLRPACSHCNYARGNRDVGLVTLARNPVRIEALR